MAGLIFCPSPALMMALKKNDASNIVGYASPGVQDSCAESHPVKIIGPIMMHTTLPAYTYILITYNLDYTIRLKKFTCN